MQRLFESRLFHVGNAISAVRQATTRTGYKRHVPERKAGASALFRPGQTEWGRDFLCRKPFVPSDTAETFL